MKIGIVTIDSVNYGNKLQNYALQHVLRDFGFEVETYFYNTTINNIHNKIKMMACCIVRSKAYKFSSFRKLIKWSQFTFDTLYLNKDITNQYKYFIAGSDQIWNPLFSFNGIANFLTFVRPEKRISYAASFGVNHIPLEKKKDYIKWLSEIPNISVREETGADIVEELIGVRPQVVLDPTLLLTSAEWHKIAKKPSFKLPKKYALKYFLGNSDENVSTVQNYLSDEKGLNTFDIRALNKMGKEIPVGPSEFLYLIENAECVITDSFHGSVFSILFKKPFVVFDRKDKEKDISSRIDSLCSMFKLNANRYGDEKFDIENLMKLDYSHVEAILLKEKEKSLSFLRKSLNIQ